MPTDLILGTAGHIDHGKTALVQALTGVNTDRLPEEKRRGITIELGFAELQLDEFRLGMVDVPGHERLVRQMVAGATGMDLVLLVVAADESVKAQTREHVDILRMVDLDAAVIAITKCDLVDDEWLQLVEEDVGELVADTFLSDAPIVRTSAKTSAGLDELRAALHDAATRASRSRAARQNGPFRLPIDRVFTVAGHGTVVTGSVATGRLRVGDHIDLIPSGTSVRIRGLENHDRTVDTVQPGQRAAVNLAGIDHDQVTRGQELSTPGYLAATRLMTVDLTLLPTAPRDLKHRAVVRTHLGTSEMMARVSLLQTTSLAPGESTLAQLDFHEPAAAVWGQPFVLRAESPVVTLGGGRVLDPSANRLRRSQSPQLQRLADLRSTDPAIRAAAAVFLRGAHAWEPADLHRLAGIDDPDKLISDLVAAGNLIELSTATGRTTWIEASTLEALTQRVRRLLQAAHKQDPLSETIDTSRIAHRLRDVGDQRRVDALLALLARRGAIRLDDRAIALADHRVELSAAKRTQLDDYLKQIEAGGSQPPFINELQRDATSGRDAVRALLSLAVNQGKLVEIAPDFLLNQQVETRLRNHLASEFAGRENAGDEPGLTVSDIRKLVGMTRKYAVPYCEFLDRIGFTRRVGDRRVLVVPTPTT